jgi:hypothetical protein
MEITPCILSDHKRIKLEFNKKRNSRRYSNTWINNKSLHDQSVAKEIKEEIKKFLESSENESSTYHNFWYTAKAMLRGKFISMTAYIESTERAQINDLMLYLKLLEKQ